MLCLDLLASIQIIAEDLVMEKRSGVTIVFNFGPPGPEEEKRKIEEWSNNSGKSKDEVWVEYVQALLSSWAHRNSPKTTCSLDELFSLVLGTPARVIDPFIAWMVQDGVRYPSLAVDSVRITAPSGEPLIIDFSDRQLQEAIASMFGVWLKAEWVRTVIGPCSVD